MKRACNANFQAATIFIINSKSIATPETYFGFQYARQYSTMLIEPSIYLSALLRDFYIAGGRVVVKEFKAA
jgi:hypothetical protein